MEWTQVGRPVILEPLTVTVWQDQGRSLILGGAMLGLLE